MGFGSNQHKRYRKYCKCDSKYSDSIDFCDCNSTGIRQEYSIMPRRFIDVRGLSSGTIFIFMNCGLDGIYQPEYHGPEVPKHIHGKRRRIRYRLKNGHYTPGEHHTNAPNDVDDWERNRALLLCYPHWRNRINEMSEISVYWEVLVNNWNTIEEKYNNDIELYGKSKHDVGECNKYIKTLLSSVKEDYKLFGNKYYKYYKFWWNQ